MVKIYRLLLFVFLLLNQSVFSQNLMEYAVKNGETLKEIAEKFETGYIQLLRVNKGISRKPEEGTVVKVPINPFVKQKHPKDLKPEGFNFHKAEETLKPQKQTHKVMPKETIYGLAKQYGITIKSLIKENPILVQEGLKIDQVLLLPNNVLLDTISANKKNYHIVLPKETLYSLSEKYKVEIEALKKNNESPLLDGLTIGDTLIIPVIIKNENPKNRFSTNNHTVKKGETLYAISKQYGISLQELLDVNDALVIDSMAVGTIVKLPNSVMLLENATPTSFYKEEPIKYNYNRLDVFENVLKKLNVTEDSLKSINPSFDSIKLYGGELLVGFKKKNFLFSDNHKFKDSIVTNKLVKLMLMLPFDLERNQDKTYTSLFSNKGFNNMVADIYLGAKIAIDSLLKQRVKVDLKIVDTKKSVDSIHQKIERLRIYKPNLIVGPLYTNNVRYVASSFPKVPVYYPIYSKNQKTLTASNIVKTATEKNIFKLALNSYIKRNRQGEHLLIVGKEKNWGKLEKLKEHFVKKDSLNRSIKNNVTILPLKTEYVSKEDFEKHIKKGKPNWILISENSRVITSDVINNSVAIASDSIKTPIKILAYEKSKFVKDNVSYETLANYNYTYATDEVVYSNFLTNSFSNKYLQKYKAYPSKYVKKGFAVVYDAVQRFLKQESNDRHKATQRLNQAFYYEKPLVPEQFQNENQAIFVNVVKKENNEIFIERLQ